MFKPTGYNFPTANGNGEIAMYVIPSSQLTGVLLDNRDMRSFWVLLRKF